MAAEDGVSLSTRVRRLEAHVGESGPSPEEIQRVLRMLEPELRVEIAQALLRGECATVGEFFAKRQAETVGGEEPPAA
jgi:hypothetical protein